jgi:hypothetical protein
VNTSAAIRCPRPIVLLALVIGLGIALVACFAYPQRPASWWEEVYGDIEYGGSPLEPATVFIDADGNVHWAVDEEWKAEHGSQSFPVERMLGGR